MHEDNNEGLKRVLLTFIRQGMKTLEESNAEGVHYCRPVKTSHKGIFLATLEKLMKEWPGVSHLVMNSASRVPGDKPRMVIRCRYIYKNIIGFVSAEVVGSTEPGVPYFSHYPHIF